MKVSHNNSRTQGSASHNDRTFDVWKADHIDLSRLGDNRYWCVYEGMDFEAAERKYYEEHYGQMIHDQNRYRAEKLDVGDYLRMSRYCPEELILQIGSVGDTVKDPAVFDACFDRYMEYLEEWNREHGGHMHVLDYAVHKDEATIHAHIRRVWDYTGKDGEKRIGMDRALKEAGVQPPEPGMPEGRRNNRKIAFDRMMRERWIGICEEHGIEVDQVPGKARHQHIDDYKRDRRIEEISRSRQNALTVRELVEKALSSVPEEKRAVSENGETYARLSTGEYEALSRAAGRMVSDREEVKRKEAEAAAARGRAEEARKRVGLLKEENGRLERETARIKEEASRVGDGLLADAMQKGWQAVREPDGRELEVFGAAGQAYDASRYQSVYEAMDSLERAYLGEVKDHGMEERGG